MAALAIVVAFHTLPTVGVRELSMGDEVRHASALQHLLEAGHWVVLHMNGAPYPDKPPLYFWFLALLATVFGTDRPFVFLLGVALSALALLVTTYALARTVAVADRPAALRAALLPLGCIYVVGVAHYARPDFVFAALITASHLCLFRAWIGQRGWWVPAGLALGGLAVLTKGPLGLLLPLATGVVYLAWRGRLARLWRPDVAAGLAIGLALPLAWLAAAWAVEGGAFVRSLLVRQVYERATASFAHAEPPWHYARTLPLVWLPFTLIAVGRPWRVRLADRVGVEGRAYLVSALASGFVVLSAISIKLDVYLLPLIPPLAILTAATLASMDTRDARRVRAAVALGLLIAGVGISLLPLLRPAVPAVPARVSGLLLAALGLVIVMLGRSGLDAALGSLVLGLALWFNVSLWLAAPAFDARLSPRAQADVMRGYVARGHVPIAHNITRGTYAYYVRGVVRETRRLEVLADLVERHDQVVVAMPYPVWERWAARPEGLRVVHRQRIAEHDAVLLARPP